MPGLQVDQIAPAILNAPGATVEMLRKVPGGTYSTASGTFVPINAAMNGSFVVPVAGIYVISFTVQAYAISSAVHARYRLSIDSGATIVGTDDVSWQQHLNTSSHEGRTFVGSVFLTAGSHTISPEWRVAVGGGSAQVDTNDSVVVQGTLVSGSGAGGVITTAAVLPSNVALSVGSPLDWKTVTGLTASIITSANEYVLVTTQLMVEKPSGGLTNICAAITVDGSRLPNLFVAGEWTNNHSHSRIVGPLSAGSHTIGIDVTYAQTTGTIDVWGLSDGPFGSCSRLDVIQFRGGLVPINKDGTEVITAPRALNFIGSGVSVNANTGAADIQLNSALTAPGVFVEMLRHVSTNSDAMGSAVWADMGVGGNLVSGSFVAAVAGTYALWLSPRNIFTGNYSQLRFRIVFDAGTGSEQIIGTDDAANDITDADRESSTFNSAVTLTAGSHTIKVQYKKVSGGGAAVYSSGFSSVQVVGTLVSGSGAGGVLTASAALGSDVALAASWTDVAGLSVTITTSANEMVFASFAGDFFNSSGTGSGGVRLMVDTTILYPEVFGTCGVTWSEDASFSRLIGPLAAGSHTIKLQGFRDNPTSLRTGSRLDVQQFRGGLVPVRKDGASVIDTPAAFDFVGPGCQVTNIGGTAKIALAGAEGTLGVPVESSLTPQTISSVVPTYTDITGLTKTITTSVANELVLVTVAGQARTTSGACNPNVAVLVDGSVEHVNVTWTGTSTATMNISFSVVLKIATPGSHTIKLAGAKTLAGESNWNVEPGPLTGYSPTDGWKFDVVQFRGGYVQPENIPILEYSSASVVNVKAGPGASSELRLLLNDGARYKATSPLTVNLATTGLGGLDTGTEASSTWYYVYAVPSATSGYFSVVASVTPPTGGPTGYSIWKYLGALRNDGSSNIIPFYQVGAAFKYMKWINGTASAGLGTTLYTVKTTLSMADVVPATAVFMEGLLEMQHDATGGYNVYSELYIDGQSNFWTTSYTGNTWTHHKTSFLVPMPTTPKQVGYVSNNNGAGAVSWQAISTQGWVDGYLAGLPSQLQAQYQPDAALPQLTWVANSQVTVAAALGQAITVKATLQDGIQRSFTGTLTWDPSTGVIDGGLDTGTEAVSTWYYLYLVPRYGVDQLLHVRGSVNPPSVGPSGYANHKYIGAVRNNASGNLIQFCQSGSDFDYIGSVDTGLGLLADASPTALDMSGLIPATSSAVVIQADYRTNGSAYGNFSFWPDGGQSGNAALRVDAWNSWDGSGAQGTIATPTTPKKVYYQRYSSSGNPASCSAFVVGWRDGWLGGAVTGTALQGAQGGIHGQVSLAAASDYISSTSWADVSPTNLTVTFTAVAGERVKVVFAGWASSDIGATTGELTLNVDGSDLWGGTNDLTGWYGAGSWHRHDVSFVYITDPLTAGSHTIKLRVKKAAGGDSNWKIYAGAQFTVEQLRGGYVPVQKDGVEVVSTPTAFDFTGPGCQVTNVGGAAKIALTSSGYGTIKNPPFWSAVPADELPTVTPTLQAGNYTVACKFSVLKAGTKITGVSFYSLKTGSYTMRCKLWKYAGSTLLRTVDVACSGPGYYEGYFSTPYEVSAAEAPETVFYTSMWDTTGVNWTEVPSSPYSNTVYPMRGYLYWDRATSYGAGDSFPGTTSATQTFLVDPILEMVGDPAAYVIPENIPILEYSSASVVNVKAAPGASSTLRLLLNDGMRYQASGTLTVDLTVSGRGGIDSGSEASSTWYYVYAVPSLTAGYFSVLCSVNPPSTGPTGYSIWRYLGAFRNNSSSDIVKFSQVGSVFEYKTNTQPLPFTGAGSADAVLQVLALASYIPQTAYEVHLGGYIQVNAAGSMYVFVDGEADITSGTTRWNTSHARLGGNAAAEVDHLNAWVPTPGTKQVGYYREVAFTESRIDCFGWKDGYLSGQVSQLQAKYAPDTSLPQLTYSSAAAINVASAPGQNATVALTLQDGKQRTFTGTLAWSFINGVADLGLDTGAEAGSTWYYMYAVPKSGADDFLTVRASVTSPATGPTGYSNWKYLGAFRNNASSDIIKFYHAGNEFAYANVIAPSDLSLATLSTTKFSTPTTKSLADAVPATAYAADLEHWLCGTAVAQDIFVTSVTTEFSTAWCDVNTDRNYDSCRLPTPGSPKQLDYKCDGTTITYQEVLVRGWIDAYLAPPQAAGSGAPGLHAAAHKNGGSDEVATGTPAAYAIPKADASSKLDSWVTANAVAGTASLRQLGTGATDACAGNDSRLSDSRTPTAHDAFGALHNAGSLSDLNGKISDANLGTPVTASASTPVTLAASDSGNVYTNEGASAEIEFDLPTAAAGLNFTFIVQDTDGIKVVAATGDTIRIAGSVSASAGNITAATIGNTVKLIAINATEWIAVAYVGTWTVT